MHSGESWGVTAEINCLMKESPKTLSGHLIVLRRGRSLLSRRPLVLLFLKSEIEMVVLRERMSCHSINEEALFFAVNMYPHFLLAFLVTVMFSGSAFCQNSTSPDQQLLNVLDCVAA
ncbi:hypothetical protein CDAR_258091, partial [Caerostris darwini]